MTASAAGDVASVSVFVAVTPDDAFDVFTREIDLWWRRGPQFRIAGKRRGQLFFEAGVGGRMFETFEQTTGSRTIEVGKVTHWEPPRRLELEWRGVNFKPHEKTFVDVRFEPQGEGTLVTVRHRGWSALPEDHPVRHGLVGSDFSRTIGTWWGQLLTSLREHVADKPRKGELARDGDLSLRPMRHDAEDFARMLAWRRAPHVREFWDNDDENVAGVEETITVAFIEENYASATDPESATVATFIVLDGEPIGYLQFYPWAAYPEGAEAVSIPMDGVPYGLDVFIGDPSCVGRGLGSRAVDLACRHLFESRGATRVALTTDLANVGAQRAYEKAGFTRVKRVFDTDTRGGVRIESWLMVRERAT